MKRLIKEQQQVKPINAPADELRLLQSDFLKDRGTLMNLSYDQNSQPQPVNVGNKLYTAGIKTEKGNYIVYDGRVLKFENGKYDYIKTANGQIGSVKGMVDSNLSQNYKSKLDNFGIAETNVYSVLSQSKNKLQELIDKGAIGDLFRDFNDLLQYYYPNDQTMRLIAKENSPFDRKIDKDELETKYTTEDLKRYGLKGIVYTPKTAGADIVQTQLTSKDLNCQATLSNYFVNALQYQGTKQETLNKNQIDTSKKDIQRCYGLGAYDRQKFKGFDNKNTPVEVRKDLSPYGMFNRRLSFKEIRERLSQIPKYSLEGLLESSEDRIKNLLRESLMEIKEQKKKTLLEESKIVKGRLTFITENSSFKTKKEKDNFCKDLLSEMIYLNSQGFNQGVINEGFFDILKSLFGNAGESTIQYFKEYLAKWLITSLTPFDTDGWVGGTIVKAIGNLPIGDIPKLTDCNFTTKLLSKSIAEEAIDQIKRKAGLEGAFYDILRNAVIESLSESDLGQKIESALGSVLCPMLSKISGNMDSAAEQMKKGALSL